MKADEAPRLSVILVNFRSLPAIRGLFASGLLDGHRVIVVDNGDDPEGVCELCSEHGAQPLLHRDNLGFAAAVNSAVATIGAADDPWLLLNPDVTVTPDQLAELWRQLEVQAVDGVAPLLRLPDGTLQIGPGGGPLTLRSVMAYFLFVSHLLPWCRGVFFTRRQSLRIRRVDWLCMACVMLVPDAFDRFGPIPEDELVYAEDIAWGTLATSHGARFRLVPSVLVGHESGASGGSSVWHAALERLARRRLGPVRGILALMSIRVGLRARRLIRALQREGLRSEVT